MTIQLTSLARRIAGYYWSHRVPQIRWQVVYRHHRRCRNSRRRLTALRGAHAGRTIFCLGNGPSVREQDLRPLNGQVVLLTNRAYQLLDRFTPAAAYHVVTDTGGFNKLGAALRDRPEPTFVSGHILYDGELRPDLCAPGHIYLMPAFQWVRWGPLIVPLVITEPGFSPDLTRCIFPGWSVIFGAIQIAHHLGARRIALVGVDMNYTGDPSKDYGVKRTDSPPMVMDYEKHAKPMFECCGQALGQLGVDFINATAGGRVDCVRRMSLEDVGRES